MIDEKLLTEREERVRNAIENLVMAAETSVSGATAMAGARESLEILRLARLGLAAKRGAAYAAGFEAAKAAALECVLNGENIPNSYYTADIEEAIEALAALPKDVE